MLSQDKTSLSENIVSNANLFIIHEGFPIKVWHGDFDLEKDSLKIKCIKKEISEEYVKKESDGRNLEIDETLIEKALWKT